MNDPEVMRYLESRFRPQTDEAIRAYVAQCAADPTTLLLAIVVREGDRHVGNVKLGPIDPHHGTADIGILLGARETWGRGFASEALELLAAHAFQDLRVRKLTAGAYGPNIGSVRAFERAGFTVEGVRKAQFLSEDRAVDHVMMGLMNPEMTS
jgi:RimJ/RimL family protein N-acetyltransferase